MAAKTVEKDRYLFREGEPPDAMYVVKSGRLAVVKMKQNNEIILAEIGPGSMVGEMAFFDGKPRSASVKAIKDTELIVLPYKQLHAQFSSFPEWSKAIMRTVNDHLRAANQRLRQLEKPESEEGEMFPPHTITKLVSILNLVGHRYGTKTEEGLLIPGSVLRNYTIQIFQEPTHKMQKLSEALGEMGLMHVENVGDGKIKTVIKQPDLLFGFVEWYNEWLFKKETDRITLNEHEHKLLKGVLHFAKKLTPTEKGDVQLNLTEIQNDSMRDIKFLIKVEEIDLLIEKKLVGEKIMTDKGLFASMNIPEAEKSAPYWGILFALKKYHR